MIRLLDHKLLEFAAALPQNFKVNGFTTKYLAKVALKDRLPKEILERKKVGFPVPYDTWMRTELKDWVREVLLDRESIARGYFNRQCIENLIAALVRGAELERRHAVKRGYDGNLRKHHARGWPRDRK